MCRYCKGCGKEEIGYASLLDKNGYCFTCGNKYYKNLNHFKDLDEKEYLKTIRAWQRRDLNACNLVVWMYCMLDKDCKLVFRSRVNEFLNETCVGK